jgi:hypothetical protein
VLTYFADQLSPTLEAALADTSWDNSPQRFLPGMPGTWLATTGRRAAMEIASRPACLTGCTRPTAMIVGSVAPCCGKPPRQRGERDRRIPTVAANLPILSSITSALTTLGPAALGYVLLITTVALTAVFSAKLHRRKAAIEVLRVLVPGRRNLQERPDHRPTRRPRQRPDSQDRSPPPNP